MDVRVAPRAAPGKARPVTHSAGHAVPSCCLAHDGRRRMPMAGPMIGPATGRGTLAGTA